jgi:hypothetical protein
MREEAPMEEPKKAMTLRLAADQAAALEVVAEIDGVSMSEAIRDAIENHIDSRRIDDEFQRRLADSIKRHQHILDRLTNS